MLERFAQRLLRPVRGLAGAWRAARRTVASVPDLVDAILVLPHLSEPPMHSTLERMATLLDRVDANTAAVDQLTQIVLPLEGAAMRVGRMADRWPARHRPRPLTQETTP